MAKLRDTAVKDNLNIAGSVVAGGKVLSVEGHTHTPANITGLDTYINQKIQAAGGVTGGGSGTPATPTGDINAKTLDGHPASDFILKTDSSNDRLIEFNKYLPMSNTLNDHLIIEFTEALSSNAIFIVEDDNTIIVLNNLLNIVDIRMKRAADLYAFWHANSLPITAIKASGITNIALFNLNLYNAYGGNTNFIVSVRVICDKDDFNKIKISTSTSSKYNSLPKSVIQYELNINNFLLYGNAINVNSYNSNPELVIFKPNFKYDKDKGLLVSTASTGVFIIDLDSGKFIGKNNNYPWFGSKGNETNKVFNYSINNLFLVDLTGFSNNTIVICKKSYAIPTAFKTLNLAAPKLLNISTSELSAFGYDIDKLRSLFSINNKITINGTKYNLSDNITITGSGSGGGEINCNINGIHFDGKTDITIPAPTNALTLGGLDSSQYIKATDVGNAAGKIPKFDNDGFLVYPDGSKERIENA